MKQEDKKHPQKWCLLSTMDAWHKFKAHTMFLDWKGDLYNQSIILVTFVVLSVPK